MAKTVVSGSYRGRANAAVEWEAIERIFDAVWGRDWRHLPEFPQVIGGVWADWQDAAGLTHVAESLSEVQRAYRAFETARVSIRGSSAHVPHTHFEYRPSTAEAAVRVEAGDPVLVRRILSVVKSEFPITSHAATALFVVHGRDEVRREEVVAFLKEIGVDRPIVLHEQPSRSRTLIEKLEHYSAVDFAIVLLTSDDVGGLNADSLRSRARQNVIFELGYFLARVGRENVCALYEEGVELPSDVDGVVYVKLDAVGRWKEELVRELSDAGFAVALTDA